MKTKCGEIFWDEEEGFGWVTFEPTFQRDEPITCLDAINDWMLGMANEYNDHMERSQQKFDDPRRQARRAIKKPKPF